MRGKYTYSNRINIMLITFLTTITFISYEASAESLWKNSHKQNYMYGQKRALGVGDTVTVLVSEEATASQESSTQTSGKSTNNITAGTGFMGFIPLGTSDSNVNYDGAGTTTNSNTLTAKMTVRIIKVLPNGNFQVSGKRMIKINNESQEIYISGELRPDDIKADNTVESTYLSDARIEYKGKGTISRTQKPGILNKVLHWFL